MSRTTLPSEKRLSQDAEFLSKVREAKRELHLKHGELAETQARPAESADGDPEEPLPPLHGSAAESRVREAMKR